MRGTCRMRSEVASYGTTALSWIAGWQKARVRVEQRFPTCRGQGDLQNQAGSVRRWNETEKESLASHSAGVLGPSLEHSGVLQTPLRAVLGSAD